jgi:hypothetical protein
MRDLFNKISNIFMIPLLRSPLHFLVSGSYMLITFTGRKSGKIYTTPVEYRQENHTLTVFTQRRRSWWKNFQGGAPITLRLRGHEVRAMAEIGSMDEADLRDTFKRMYPRIPTEQAVVIAPRSVMLKIHLPQTDAVQAH